MKKMITVICIVVGVALIAGVGFACHSKTSSAPDADTPAESNLTNDKAQPAPEAKEDEALPVFDLQRDKEWISYYEDSELSTTKLFDVALNVVKSKGASGELSPFASVRFANWFILSYKAVVFDEANKLDGEIEHGSAFVVDLSKKQVIGKDHINDMLPLAKRIIELVESDDHVDKSSLVFHLASAAATIFRGNTGCYDNPGDELHPSPKLEKIDDHTHVIKFYMAVGAQAMPQFDECTLTITDSEITFKSERK